MIDNGEMQKCSTCGDLTDYDELSEYDGVCYHCYRREMAEYWAEKNARESEGR